MQVTGTVESRTPFGGSGRARQGEFGARALRHEDRAHFFGVPDQIGIGKCSIAQRAGNIRPDNIHQCGVNRRVCKPRRFSKEERLIVQ